TSSRLSSCPYSRTIVPSSVPPDRDSPPVISASLSSSRPITLTSHRRLGGYRLACDAPRYHHPRDRPDLPRLQRHHPRPPPGRGPGRRPPPRHLRQPVELPLLRPGRPGRDRRRPA